MSFPIKAPSSHPPGLKLGVFAGGGPFPRLVAPGIVVGDPARLAMNDPAYLQMGLTHVLVRSTGAAQCSSQPQPQLQDGRGMVRTGTVVAGPVALVIIGERQTLRQVVELLVRVRVAAPCGRILVGEPYVAAAYLMAIEGRDLRGTWRLVTGSELEMRGKVFREVHGVLNRFAREVEEEGKRLAREEEEREREERALQPPL
jgi:hypothetical protein